MKDNKTKRPWCRPELKILVKGETEESVLGSCKNHASWLGGGPEGIDCRSLLGYFCSQDTAS